MPGTETAAQTASQTETGNAAQTQPANAENAANPSQTETGNAANAARTETSQTQQPGAQGILNQNPDSLPIADWSKVDLGLGDKADINPDLLQSFGKDVAVKLGLTPAQAKGAVEWQLNAIAAQRKQYQEAQTAELKKAWGADFQVNGQKVLNLVENIDRKQGNDSFSKALASIGALDSAQAITGLLTIAKLLEEDSLGNSKPDNLGNATETAEQGIEELYRQARRGRM